MADKILSQAESFIKERAMVQVEASKPALIHEVQQQFNDPDSLSNDPILVQLMERFSHDPSAREEFGARILLRQLASGFKKLFATHAQPFELNLAGAKLTHTVTVSRTAEERIGEDTRSFPILAERYFTPEITDAIENTTTHIMLYTFPDQSIVALGNPDPLAVKNLKGLLGTAKNFKDIAGEFGDSRASRLADSFLQMSADLRTHLKKNLRSLSSAQLQEITEEFCFDAIKSVMTQSRSAYPMKDANVLIGQFVELWEGRGMWRSGVTMHVNDQAVESSIELPAIFGVKPLLNVKDLLSSFMPKAKAALQDPTPNQILAETVDTRLSKATRKASKAKKVEPTTQDPMKTLGTDDRPDAEPPKKKNARKP